MDLLNEQAPLNNHQNLWRGMPTSQGLLSARAKPSKPSRCGSPAPPRNIATHERNIRRYPHSRHSSSRMPSLASPRPNTRPEIPPFPSPQTFDILPEIYALIARLQLPSSNLNDPSAAQSTDSLTPKDLPAAAVPIKLKIQKARSAVQALPDVSRTVEEQEREIKALEGRNESLRLKVEKLAELARRAREADISASVEGGMDS